MKRIIALFLVVCMVLSVAACTPADTESSSSDATTVAVTDGESADPYKIGVIIPLSGNLAFFAAYFQPILDIYVDNLNAEGGINGHNVELIYKDTQGDPTITAQRLDELGEENVSAVIGPFMDTAGPAAAQWATENQIPVVMCCGLSTDIGMANASDYVFVAGSNPWAWAKIYANAVNDAGYTSAYYIGNEGGVPDDVYNYFWEEMEKLNPDVVNAGSVRLSGSETDLSSVITSIMAIEPDVIITSLTGGGAITFITQGSQFGLFDVSDLYGVYIAGADHTSAIGSAYPAGKIYSIDWFPVNFSFSQDWATEIYQAAGEVIPNGASLNFYYAADTICQALGMLDYSERNDSAKLVAALESIKVKSPLDENTEVYYTKYNHQLIFPMYFTATKFDDNWGGIALTDESDYTVYGVEVFPSEEEWASKAAELGY